jgi:hypothetical protein
VPPATTNPQAQTLRALVLATVASGAATVAHALGGGHLVSGTGVVVATALLTGATLPFVRQHLSAARGAVLLATLQVAAHVVHAVSAMAAGPVHAGRSGAAAARHALPSHEAHGIRPLGRIETAAGVHDAATASPLADLLPSPTMLLAHLVAAIAVGLLLTRGERSWVAARALLVPLAAGTALLVGALLLRALVHHAAALWAAIGTTAARLVRPLDTASDGPVPDDVWHARTPVRRGPPALLA